MKNAFGGPSSGLGRAEDRIRGLEETSAETSETEEQRGKNMKNLEQDPRVVESYGRYNIHITGAAEREGRQSRSNIRSKNG